MEHWPIVNRIAYFKHHYPHEWSRPEYKTDDKIVPYSLFEILIKAAQANRALERLNMLSAVQLGYASARSDDSSLARIREDTVQEALGKL